MKIKRLVIENFKSIERIELIEPNPFTVFVGPNGSGKSNIFEALEFFNIASKVPGNTVDGLFGGPKAYHSRNNILNKAAKIDISFDSVLFKLNVLTELSKDKRRKNRDNFSVSLYEIDNPDKSFYKGKKITLSEYYSQFIDKFSRLFFKRKDVQKLNLIDNYVLSLSGDNLEPVLKRILTEDVLRDEIFEWLELFVPGFKAVEVDDRDELHWFEKSTPDYFTKDLISDGTYNILALLTAVYQSDDKPQFLCIEEPENGLHPQVAGELVDFFRIMCEERGHYIWLNTHSQSMASRVRPEEFVVVEKKQGDTTARQFKREDFHGMRADEAWLTNALNGGLAW